MRLNAERLWVEFNQPVNYEVQLCNRSRGCHGLALQTMLLVSSSMSRIRFNGKLPLGSASECWIVTATEKVSRWTVRFRFCLHHRVLPQFQPPSTRGTTDLNQTAALGFDLNQNSPACFFRRHDNSELPCCYDGVSSSLRQTHTVLHLTTERHLVWKSEDVEDSHGGSSRSSKFLSG